MDGLPSWLALILFALLLSGGALMPGFTLAMLYALRSIRLDVGPAYVRLRGVDGTVMGVGLVVASIAVALTLMFASCFRWHVCSSLLAVSALLFAPLGCRFNLKVTHTHARMVRRILWIIPWRIEESCRLPAVYTDGWGDWADPEALVVDMRRDRAPVEVAWGGARSGNLADEIADGFTHAVCSLRSELSAYRRPAR